MQELYGFKEKDTKFASIATSRTEKELPENGNFFQATLRGSTQLAKNMSLRQFWVESMNSGVIECEDALFAGFDMLAIDGSWKIP